MCGSVVRVYLSVSRSVLESQKNLKHLQKKKKKHIHTHTYVSSPLKNCSIGSSSSSRK